MSGVIFTENKQISDLVKYEFKKGFGWCRVDVPVTVASATDLVIGSVLGKVTATGVYVPRDPDAADGSEVSAAVVVVNTSVAAATATPVTAFVRGAAILAEQSLVFDVEHSDAEKAEAIAELLALDIQTRTQLYA